MERKGATSSCCWLAILAIATLGQLANSQTNYCSRELCPSGTRHIACNNDENFASGCSKGAKLIPISAEAQNILVTEHNKVRQLWASGKGKVNAKACRMATIRWDPELAKLAELNVKSCELKHDACHNTKTYKTSGQNIYLLGVYGQDGPNVESLVREALTKWINEGNSVNAKQLAKFPSDYNKLNIGHFTVMAQELNTAIGCAASNYMKDDYDTYLIACNYASTNFIDGPVYKSCANAAASCDTGTNAEYPALCSLQEKIQT